MQRALGALFGLVIGLFGGFFYFGPADRVGGAGPGARRGLRSHADGGRRDRDYGLVEPARRRPSLVSQARALADAARGADQLAAVVAVLMAAARRDHEPDGAGAAGVSSRLSRLALPPTAAVLIVTVRSVAKRSR